MATIRERKSSMRSPRSRSSPYADRYENKSHPDPELSRVSQTYDAIGQRLSLNDPARTTRYTYDITCLLTYDQSSGSNSYNITYTYDPVGNRLAKIAGGVPTTNTYDVANELVTSKSSNGTTTNTWDANGNLLINSAPSNQLTTYTWDFENRMTQASLPSGIVDTFEYDGDGKRVQKVDSSGTSNFLWDGENILLETDSSNIVQVVNTIEPDIYGNNLSQIRSGITSILLFDGCGNTTQLIGSTGLITDSYILDSFGNSILIQGSTANPYRFNGHFGYFLDQDIIKYSIRSSFYSSNFGRFISIDPFPTINPYLYSMNNSLLYIDPSEMKALIWNHADDCPPKFPNPEPIGILCPGEKLVPWPNFAYGKFCGANRVAPCPPILSGNDCVDDCCEVHDCCLKRRGTSWNDPVCARPLCRCALKVMVSAPFQSYCRFARKPLCCRRAASMIAAAFCILAKIPLGGSLRSDPISINLS